MSGQSTHSTHLFTGCFKSHLLATCFLFLVATDRYATIIIGDLRTVNKVPSTDLISSFRLLGKGGHPPCLYLAQGIGAVLPLQIELPAAIALRGVSNLPPSTLLFPVTFPCSYEAPSHCEVTYLLMILPLTVDTSPYSFRVWEDTGGELRAPPSTRF